MNPSVTVYIANHNYGRYLDEAVGSVLKQTFQDFELIVIDDGSTDDSRSVIEKYAEHPKVRVIYQEQKGLNVTNNVALRAARGKYLMRLDADDYLDENALHVMQGILERKPEVGLVFPDYYHVDAEGGILEQVRRHDFKNGVTLLDSPAHGACTLIRRQCLVELGGYNEDFSCQDGYELWLRFIARYPVENVNLPLFYYRRHGANLTDNENRILETRGKILSRHAARSGKGTLETLALVPIRGPRAESGSLAFEPLGGRLFMDWTLDAALEVPEIKSVMVSSPDENVLKHVNERYGAKIAAVPRPARMARQNMPLDATFLSLAEKYVAENGEPGAVFELFIDFPFRSSAFLQKAIDLMKIFDVDSVIGVRVETDQFYHHDGGGLVPVRSSSQLRLEREEIYRQGGGMALLRYAYFKDNPRIGGRMGHVVLDQKAAMRATSALDLRLMRALAGDGA